MNRRSFLSSFLKAGTGLIVAPQIITHGLGLIKPRLIVNPAWVTAEYEITFIPTFQDFMDTIPDTNSVETWKKIIDRTKWKPNMGVIKREVNSLKPIIFQRRQLV